MNKSKEIIYLLPALRFGGIQIFALDLAFFQINKGQKIKIISLGSEYTVLKRYSDFKKDSLRKVISLMSLFQLYTFFFKIIFLRKKITIHTQGHLLSHVGFLSIFRNIEIIHTVQNQAEYEAGLSRMRLHSFYFKKLGVTSVANSKEIAQSFFSYYGFNTNHIIMNGIDLEELASNDSHIKLNKNKNKNHVVLCSIGSFGSHKNQRLLIDAFIEVNDPLSTLYIVGKNYNNYLDDIYLADIQKYPINIINEEKNSFLYLDASDIFCMSSNYEGLPLTLMEAKMKNKTIVTTNAGGSKEVLDDNDYVVEVDDFKGYVKALKESINAIRQNRNKNMENKSRQYLRIERCYQDYLKI